MGRPRLVVGISGASGAAYGLGVLDRARALGVETHLIVTPSGVLNVHHELGLDRAQLEQERLAARTRSGDKEVGRAFARQRPRAHRLVLQRP